MRRWGRQHRPLRRRLRARLPSQPLLRRWHRPVAVRGRVRRRFQRRSHRLPAPLPDDRAVAPLLLHCRATAMNDQRHRLRLALVLLLPSLAAYATHYAIFRNAHDIFYYLLMDVAFLFVQGLLVTLVLEQLLNARERQATRVKQNMVIGVFYSEVGTRLLAELCAFDRRAGELAAVLRMDGASRADFARMR